jgi:hypothetical protein
VKRALKYFFGLVVAVYMISNTGIPVYYHYCGGELESVNALFKSTSCCGDDEDENSDCCQNETKVLAQKSESSLQPVHFKIAPASLLFFSCIKTEHSFPQADHHSIFPPDKHFFPPGGGRDILRQNAVLII